MARLLALVCLTRAVTSLSAPAAPLSAPAAPLSAPAAENPKAYYVLRDELGETSWSFELPSPSPDERKFVFGGVGDTQPDAAARAARTNAAPPVLVRELSYGEGKLGHHW